MDEIAAIQPAKGAARVQPVPAADAPASSGPSRPGAGTPGTADQLTLTVNARLQQQAVPPAQLADLLSGEQSSALPPALRRYLQQRLPLTPPFDSGWVQRWLGATAQPLSGQPGAAGPAPELARLLLALLQLAHGKPDQSLLPPMLSRLMAQHPELAQQLTRWLQSASAKTVLRMLAGSVSHSQLLQQDSGGMQEGGKIALPWWNGCQWQSLELTVRPEADRDHHAPQASGDPSRAWTLRMRFELAEHGPLTVHARLQEDGAGQVTLQPDSPVLLQRVEEALPWLQSRLQVLGLTEVIIAVQQPAPHPIHSKAKRYYDAP